MGNCTIGIGMTVYNCEQYLPQAIESILQQTYNNFVLIALDDASSDSSWQILQQYALQDERVKLYRNEQRGGLVASWRQAFRLVEQNCPDLQYFAWGSDHDIWDPEWLAKLKKVLDDDPAAVLAYCDTRSIFEDGELLPKQPELFGDSGHLSDKIARFKFTCKKIFGAGHMVYGLFRAEALKKAGIFRPVLTPDRMLLLELSLYGTYRHLHQILWCRRHKAEATVSKRDKFIFFQVFKGQWWIMLQRQKRTLFPDGTTPWYVYLPSWLAFGICFGRNYFFAGKKKAGIGKIIALYLSWFISYSQAKKHYRKIFIYTIHYSRKKLGNAWRRIFG